MKKIILLWLPLLLLFISCKKDKKPVSVTYNIIGNWTLYSYQTNYGIGVNASVSQFPCMMYNTLTFYNDSTASAYYSGNDTCFITPTHVTADGAQDYGLPGLLPLTATWSQKGNAIRLLYKGNSQAVPGVVSSVNGKLQIAFKDTLLSSGHIYYITSVEIKQ